MANQQENEEIIYYKVHRSLSEPTYIRFFFIKLTEIELVVCFFVLAVTMILIDLAGFDEVVWFGFFPLDPGGYFGAAILSALIFSLLHELRPEGNIRQVIDGFFAAKFLGPSSLPDNRWIPVD